jgi:hypothetical protein
VTTVKIDKDLLIAIKKFRKKASKRIVYSSDTQFVNIAVQKLLKEEGEETE